MEVNPLAPLDRRTADWQRTDRPVHREVTLPIIDKSILTKLNHDNQEVLESGGKDIEPLQKLQDLVNKTMWKKCCFSGWLQSLLNYVEE